MEDVLRTYPEKLKGMVKMTDPIRIIRFVIVMGLLSFEAVIDLKRREINIVFPIITGVFSVIFMLLSDDVSVASSLIGLAEGVLLIALSFITDGQIGSGDGIILAATGLMLGWKDNLIMFFFSCLISAFVAVGLMGIKKADKKTKIPFIPFMVSGFFLSVFLMIF